MPRPVRTQDDGAGIRSADRSTIERLRRQHAPIARFAADRIPADVGWLAPFKTVLEKLELRAYWQRSNAVARGEVAAPETTLPGRVHEILSAFLRGEVSGGRACSRLAVMFGHPFSRLFQRRFRLRFVLWGHRWQQFLDAQAHLRRVGRSPATDALNVWLRSSQPANTVTRAERERLAGLLAGVLNERGVSGGGRHTSGVGATPSQGAGSGVASGASSPMSSGASSPSLGAPSDFE